MTECKSNDKERQAQMTLDLGLGKEIAAKFDGGLISSDGGLLLLRKADEKLELLELAVHCLGEHRRLDLVKHPMLQLLRQRVYAIASGYEDCNDAQSLRFDPMHKLALGKLPTDGQASASQPTLSRFENSVDEVSLKALQELLVHTFVRMHKKAPMSVKLRMDGTDDEVHGYQQMSFWNGFYKSECYLPLFVFDDTGFPLAAVLRPGNAAPAEAALRTLKPIVKAFRLAWPNVRIELTADAGFAVPELYDFCEDNNIYYAIGLPSNHAFEHHARDIIRQCMAELVEFGGEPLPLRHNRVSPEDEYRIWRQHEERKRFASKAEGRMQEHFEQDSTLVRRFETFGYQARPWRQERMVVMRCDYSQQGLDIRYVVTNFRGRTPRRLYEDIYCLRARCENWIKELKNQLKCDRTSCQEYLPNQFRLLLHTFAYVLLWKTRKEAGQEHVEIRTIMLRLIKVGVLVKETTRKVWLHLSSYCPWQREYALAWRHL
jgi:hypothetical protein